MLLAHPMGAGKSYIALKALELSNPTRALIVVPAIVRPMWLQLLADHFPVQDVGSLRTGRNVSSATKKDIAAYDKPWRIVSFDLLKHVVSDPVDFLIVDEAAALRSPKSTQSKALFEILRNNPKASALGLSGTYIPNEAWQLWNPLRTFFPSRSMWGNPTSSGDVAWAFKERFCKMELRHGHPFFYGLKDGAQEILKELISPFIDRVTHEEFAEYLPPLFVEPLYVDMPRERVPAQWLAGTSEIAHRGIFVHHRDVAAKLAEVSGGELITGAMSPEARQATINRLAKSEASLLVGTIDSMSEGINLSHISAALIFEWTTDMDMMLQFIGRFARTSDVSTRIEVLVGGNDSGKLRVLKERVTSASSILSAARSERLLGKLAAGRELSNEEFQAKTQKILAGLKLNAGLTGLFDDDSEDSD